MTKRQVEIMQAIADDQSDTLQDVKSGTLGSLLELGTTTRTVCDLIETGSLEYPNVETDTLPALSEAIRKDLDVLVAEGFLIKIISKYSYMFDEIFKENDGTVVLYSTQGFSAVCREAEKNRKKE